MIEQKFGGICPPEKLSTKLLYTPSDDQFKEAIQTSNFFFIFLIKVDIYIYRFHFKEPQLFYK